MDKITESSGSTTDEMIFEPSLETIYEEESQSSSRTASPTPMTNGAMPHEDTDQNRSIIDDEVQDFESEESMKEPSDNNIDTTETKLNSSDQNYNVEPTHGREGRRPHRSPSGYPSSKRQRIAPFGSSYQKNYIHVKGKTIFLEIG